MGFNRDIFMEDSKKLIILFFTFFCLLFSCKEIVKKKEIQKTIKSPNLIVKTNQGYKLRIESFKSGNDDFFETFKIKNILGDSLAVEKLIDVETFENLAYTELYKKNVKNKHFIANPIKTYFIDKNYIYIYDYIYGDDNFFIAGKAKDLEVLGGAYIKINNGIYYYGRILEGVDIESFKTINVIRRDSEWSATLGIDKKNVYLANRIESKEILLNNYFINDSIVKKYFPN